MLSENLNLVLVVVSIALIISIELASGDLALFLLFADLVIAMVLFSDFISRIKKKGVKYALLNFYEPIAYIPAILLVAFFEPHFAAFFRALRVLRLIAMGIRLMRGIHAKSMKLMSSAVMMLFLAVFLGSVSFYLAERDVQGIEFWDCIYWALITISTVGYGDIVPRTAVGKFVSMILILVGISTVSLFTASVVSMLMEKGDLKSELENLVKKYSDKAKSEEERKLLEELKKLIEKI